MTGRVALSRLVQLLERAPEEGSTTVGLPAFEPLPRAGQLVLIGDFLAPLDTVNRRSPGLPAPGSGDICCRIADPAEEELPFAGRVRFEGVEERDEIVISRVETIREDYAVRFGATRGPRRDRPSVGWTLGYHRTDRRPTWRCSRSTAALAQTAGDDGEPPPSHRCAMGPSLPQAGRV